MHKGTGAQKKKEEKKKKKKKRKKKKKEKKGKKKKKKKEKRRKKKKRKKEKEKKKKKKKKKTQRKIGAKIDRFPGGGGVRSKGRKYLTSCVAAGFLQHRQPIHHRAKFRVSSNSFLQTVRH